MSNSVIITRLTQRLFGSPIVRNSIRGEVVEEIVGIALEPEWELCAGDWASCDLRHSQTGLRIQVKQSAARQSWHGEKCPVSTPRFSIAHKTGRWGDGDKWIEEPGRNADIFIFAWHARVDTAGDHRDPDQWEFHVVGETDLPGQKTLSLAAIRELAPPVSFARLKEAVTSAAARLPA